MIARKYFRIVMFCGLVSLACKGAGPFACCGESPKDTAAVGGKGSQCPDGSEAKKKRATPALTLNRLGEVHLEELDQVISDPMGEYRLKQLEVLATLDGHADYFHFRSSIKPEQLDGNDDLVSNPDVEMLSQYLESSYYKNAVSLSLPFRIVKDQAIYRLRGSVRASTPVFHANPTNVKANEAQLLYFAVRPGGSEEIELLVVDAGKDGDLFNLAQFQKNAWNFYVQDVESRVYRISPTQIEIRASCRINYGTGDDHRFSVVASYELN